MAVIPANTTTPIAGPELPMAMSTVPSTSHVLPLSTGTLVTEGTPVLQSLQLYQSSYLANREHLSLCSHCTYYNVNISLCICQCFTYSCTLGLPSVSPPIFSTPSLHLTGARTTLSSVDISSSFIHHSPALSINPSSKVKLPKLTLRKFNGDLTKWMPFWDSYVSSIHENPGLSTTDKFVYLNSLLEGPAAESVAGLRLTAVNYEEAVIILQGRFGVRQCISICRHCCH